MKLTVPVGMITDGKLSTVVVSTSYELHLPVDLYCTMFHTRHTTLGESNEGSMYKQQAADVDSLKSIKQTINQ